MLNREASEVFGIPKSTLSGRITGKREATVGRHGRPPVLTMEGEVNLKNWCIEMAKRGFGQTPSQLKQIVKRMFRFEWEKRPTVSRQPSQKSLVVRIPKSTSGYKNYVYGEIRDKPSHCMSPRKGEAVV